MDPVNSLIRYISEDIYEELKLSLELGHWPSGKTLSDSQRALSIQALISYENLHVSEKERTAYIHKPEHDACASSTDSDSKDEEERPVKFKL